MSDKESAVSTSDEKRRFWIALLGRQNGLLNTTIAILAANPGKRVDADVARVVTLLVHAAGISVESILRLSGELHLPIRDCFGIARSVHETAANALFILAQGRETALKAERHSLQKGYRDLNRQVELGGLTIRLRSQAAPPVSQVPVTCH